MKNKILIFISLFLFSPLFGGEVNWANSLNQAKKLATTQNKLVMLMVTQKNCRACDFMKYATFKKDVVSDEVNKYFIPVMVDKHDLDFYIRGTPTFRFFTPKGKKLKYTLIGGMNYKSFLPKIQKLRKKFNLK
jgi:thioredoxin-related protein